MRIVQIVFSPTGGTQRVADLITGAWGLPVTQFDLSDPAAGCTELQLDSQDLVLIAVPSFGGRVPALAIQRLGNISGGGARCAVVCVYGNRAYEDTLIELSDAAARCGFEVIAGVAAIAEHSIFHEYATGRPDAQDAARLQDIARRILNKAGDGGSGAPAIPGNHPYKKAGGGGLVPKAESGCTGCGLCATKCPAGAIDPADPRQTDPPKCISCMRCVSICPDSARKINSLKAGAVALAIKKACLVRKECELYI